MTSGAMLPYDTILSGFLTRETPSLTDTAITACLLGLSHVPDLSVHSRFEHIEAHETSARDYTRVAVTGAHVVQTDGVPSFHTDAILFGDPVTFGPVRYMALVFGVPQGLKASSPLLGIVDLAPDGAVEAQRSAFSVRAPAGGWFSLQRG